MPRLSVAIPTFNRHAFLRTTLQALRPQARENVELVVVDNCSTPPVEEMVREVLMGSNWSFRIVRNAVNVGLCANILRCFEVGLGEWLWALGDDDSVKPDAVSSILQTLDRYPDLLFATYSVSTLPFKERAIHESVDSFFLGLDSFPRIIFISAAIYRRRELIRHLSLAYNFVDTGAPQTALLLLAGLAGEKQRLAYLPEEIVSWQPPPAEQCYSQFTAIALCKLLILCRGAVRQHLASVLMTAVPRPLRLLTHLTRDAGRGKPRPALATALDQYLDTYSNLVAGVNGALWRGPLRLLSSFFSAFRRSRFGS